MAIPSRADKSVAKRFVSINTFIYVTGNEGKLIGVSKGYYKFDFKGMKNKYFKYNEYGKIIYLPDTNPFKK